MKLAAALALAQIAFTAGPPYNGIAHVAVRVSDIEQSRQFYRIILGFAEPFQLHNKAGALQVAFIKINDRQFIELYPGLKPEQTSRFMHVCVDTPDMATAHEKLSAAGLSPWKMNKGTAGNLITGVRDPQGNLIEFIQYLPGSLHRNDEGRSLPATRIGSRILHAGILATDIGSAAAWFNDKLQLPEIRRDSADPAAWAEMRLGDGDADYLQLMRAAADAPRDERGHKEHIAIEVPSLRKAVETALARGLPKDRLKVRTSDASADLYDPDGTRIELIERKKP